MKLLSLAIFLIAYFALCYLDNYLLGEVYTFQNFLLSAIIAGLFLCILELLTRDKRARL